MLQKLGARKRVFSGATSTRSVMAEVPELILLAIPVVGGLVGGSLLSVVDSVMLGPLGEVPLAAASLTHSVLVIFYAGLYGLVGAVGVLTGQAHGAGEPQRINGILRHGLVIGLVGGLFGALAMGLVLLVLPYTGQPEAVMAALPVYWIAMAMLLVPFTLTMVIKQFLDSIGRPWMGAFLTFVPVVINIPLNWLLIYGHFGFPKLGIVGAGLASLAALSGGFGLMLLYLRYAASMVPYRDAIRLQKTGISELTREGYPMSIQYLAEGSSVAIAGVLIGLLGATALAANRELYT